MFIELLIAILLGCIAGTITGLIPGVHINLVAVSIFAVSPFLLNFTSPLILAAFIISMSITHTFTDFIPSCFLGAPESETALSVLPAHRLLLRGLSYEAIFLTVFGGLFSLIITIMLIPLIIVTLKEIYPILRTYIGYILIIVSLFLILKERKSKYFALIVFLLSGVLGLATFKLRLSEPLFPLLSGLFGISILMMSIKDKIKIPEQKINKIIIDKKTGFKSIISSVLVGTFSSFLPGLGPAQAAIITSQLFKKMSIRGFLIIVGALNTINMIISFVTLYVIDKARNGSIVIMSKILGIFNLETLILSIGIILISGAIAAIITLKLSKVFTRLISKLNYQKLCLSIILFVTILVMIITGFYGLLVLVVATFVGMLPTLKGIGKSHLMGCLLLPVILYFIL